MYFRQMMPAGPLRGSYKKMKMCNNEAANDTHKVDKLPTIRTTNAKRAEKSC